MRHVQFLFAISALGACARDVPPPDDRVAAIVEEYVPGVKLRDRLGTAAKNDHLEFAPYVGFRDTTFRGKDGLKELYLYVDEPLSDESQRPSSRARIEDIVLGVPTRDAAVAAQRRMAAAFGAPSEWCFLSTDKKARRLQFWRAGADRGVQLAIPDGAWPPGETGLLALHVTFPDTTLGMQRCPTPT